MKLENETVTNDQNSSLRVHTSLRPELGFYLHRHAAYELVLINSGAGQRFIGDSLEQFSAGELLLIGPHLPHAWLAPPDPAGYAVALFQFQGEWFSRQFAGMLECAPIMDLLQQAQRGIAFAALDTVALRQRMLTITAMDSFTRWHCLMDTLYQLSQLSLSQRRYLSSAFYNNAVADARDEKKINELCQHLLSHFTHAISQESVAVRFAMSSTALSRYFKRHTGKTFIAYIHELRIGKACELLSQTDHTVQRIADAVGFNNLSQFNRIFLRYKKISPRRFRQQLSKGLNE